MQNTGNTRSDQGRAASAQRILVVDDEESIVECLVKLLGHLGYDQVDTASDGAAAWDALHQMSYALVITDHKMPKITGLELIERMRAANMRQPVILISGTMPTEELSRKPGLRVDAMVGKPFDFAELKTVIEKILDANPGSQAERPSLALTQGNKKPSRHILVVDDERASRQLTIDLMTSSGYVAEGAHDGAAGWEALQTQHYDLVITDNHMPRMTGLEMIEKLNASRRPIPVIMATGNLPMDEFARRPSLKPKAALQKPFAVRELLDAVRNILGPDEGNEDHEETRHRESF